MEKQHGWACKLGGAEPLGISKVGQTVFAELMESQIWYQPVDPVALCGEGSEKGHWPVLILMPDTSASPYMTLVPLKPPPWYRSPEGMSLCR